MRRFELLLAIPLGGLALFVGLQVAHAPRSHSTASRDRDTGTRTTAAASQQPDGSGWRDSRWARNHMRALGISNAGAPPPWMTELQEERMSRRIPAPDRDPAAVARQLARYRQYTYIDAILAQNRQTLARWPDRTEPLHVWVQPNADIKDWRREFVGVTKGALHTWSALDIPVTFAIVDDSTQADVFVTWIDRFDVGQQIGSTYRVTDGSSWIIAANVTIAVHDVGGNPLETFAIQNCARHELGHVLGLDHSSNPADIMAPVEGGQPALSPADRTTLRLLYALPPGRVE